MEMVKFYLKTIGKVRESEIVLFIKEYSEKEDR
jgi:hypothetical protein